MAGWFLLIPGDHWPETVRDRPCSCFHLWSCRVPSPFFPTSEFPLWSCVSSPFTPVNVQRLRSDESDAPWEISKGRCCWGWDIRHHLEERDRKNTGKKKTGVYQTQQQYLVCPVTSQGLVHNKELSSRDRRAVGRQREGGELVCGGWREWGVGGSWKRLMSHLFMLPDCSRPKPNIMTARGEFLFESFTVYIGPIRMSPQSVSTKTKIPPEEGGGRSADIYIYALYVCIYVCVYKQSLEHFLLDSPQHLEARDKSLTRRFVVAAAEIGLKDTIIWKQQV